MACPPLLARPRPEPRHGPSGGIPRQSPKRQPPRSMHRLPRTSSLHSSKSAKENMPKPTVKRKLGAPTASSSSSPVKTSKRLRSSEPHHPKPSHTCMKCDQSFHSLPDLRTHLSLSHPREKIPCYLCGKCFSSHSAFSNHACLKKEPPKVTRGFFDLMDVAEFSAKSFPRVAKAFFEGNPRAPTSAYHKFKCKKCALAFPCAPALQLHQAAEQSPACCVRCKSDFSCPEDLELHRLRYSSCRDEKPASQLSETSQKSFLSIFDLAPAAMLNQERAVPPTKEISFECYSYFVSAKPKREEKSKSQVALIDPSALLKAEMGPPSPKEASVPPSSQALLLPESPQAADPVASLSEEASESHPEGRLVIAEDPLEEDDLNGSASDSPSSNTCPHCSTVYPTRSSLQQHLLTHEERIFICKICFFSFTTKANCERHLQKVHQLKDRDEILGCVQFNVLDPKEQTAEDDTTCKYCKKNFNTKRLLGLHKRSQEGCQSKPYKCEICKLGFSSKNNYKRHYGNKHSKTQSILKPMEVVSPEEENSSDSLQLSDEVSSTPKLEGEAPLNLALADSPPPDPPSPTSHGPVEEGDPVGMDLSLASPPQEEPLNLVIQPLNLCLNNATKDHTPRPASIFSLQRGPSESLHSDSYHSTSLQGELTIVAPLTPPASSEKSPFKSGDTTPKAQKKQYTCSYCLAKFTLKSNMSRHIKKKHPGNARPARSRNFIAAIHPAPVAKLPALSAVSTETKIALRSALFNKSSLLSKKTKVVAAIVPDNLSSISPAPIPATLADSESSLVEDLASVSDLIDNANLQQFKQYLDQSRDPITITISEATSDSPPVVSLVEKEDTSQPTPPTAAELPEKKRNSYSSSPKRVWCTFCHRKFPWLSSLRRHLLTHTGQKPYQCPHCPINFTTKSNCERHITKKHSQGAEGLGNNSSPFKCTICPGSSFTSESNLKKHLFLRHDLGKDPFTGREDRKESESDSCDDMDQLIPCFHCEQSCLSKEDMEAHVEDQHSDLFFKCHLCPSYFKNYKYCINHFQKLHPEEYSNLQKHEVIPSIPKEEEGKIVVHPCAADFAKNKVACSICFYHCKSNGALKTHMGTHNQDIYPCDLCNKKFEALASLSKHKEKHHSLPAIPASKPPVLQTTTTYLIGNSLLPILSHRLPETILRPSQSSHSIAATSDLIQNLLCLPDNIKIDELLGKNPDSAAEILGVPPTKQL